MRSISSGSSARRGIDSCGRVKGRLRYPGAVLRLMVAMNVLRVDIGDVVEYRMNSGRVFLGFLCVCCQCGLTPIDDAACEFRPEENTSPMKIIRCFQRGDVQQRQRHQSNCRRKPPLFVSLSSNHRRVCQSKKHGKDCSTFGSVDRGVNAASFFRYPCRGFVVESEKGLNFNYYQGKLT